VPKKKVTIIGALPVDLVCTTLDVELEPGDVILTARAEQHIAKDHPADYAIVMQCLPAAIASPTYIGQSPHHGANLKWFAASQLRGQRKSS
jgi:hypothetical protein